MATVKQDSPEEIASMMAEAARVDALLEKMARLLPNSCPPSGPPSPTESRDIPEKQSFNRA